MNKEKENKEKDADVIVLMLSFTDLNMVRMKNLRIYQNKVKRK